MDDITIFSKYVDYHIKYVSETLKILAYCRITLEIAKCHFFHRKEEHL